MSVFVLAGLGVGLAFSVFCRGGVEPADWRVTALVVGVSALIWVMRRRSEWVPELDGICRWAVFGLVAWAGLQLVPLPLPVLDVVSPRRGEMARLAGDWWAPVTVWAAATQEHVLRLLVYAATFLVARELSWVWAPGRFWAAAPVIGIAGLEAALGVVQVYGGGAVARGTYVNRNHFAGLLELGIPMAVAWGVWVLARGRGRFASPAGPVVAACGLFAVAALLLVGVLGSLSRMGFLASLAGIGVTGLALTVRPGRSWIVGAAVAAGVAGFVFLPSDPLILRFADIASTEEISRDTRSQIWSETMGMIRDYGIAGAGFGGYEDVFMRYQTVAPSYLIDYAHNDYLQAAAEGGVAALGLGLTLLWRLLAGSLRGARGGGDGRYAAAGCCGALTALALHSLVDFNLYIPANAMAAAWIGGVAASYLHNRGVQGDPAYQYQADSQIVTVSRA